MPTITRTRVAVGALFLLGAGAFWVSRSVCLPAYFKYGVKLSQCPDGSLRQVLTAGANTLRRGASGGVYLSAAGHYATKLGGETSVPLELSDVKLSLVDSAGKATPLEPEGKEGWGPLGSSRNAQVKLPSVPDGEYQLRATGKTPAGEAEVTLPLALFAPAQVHVLTDRPLYQPGDLIKFRAVVLRARDLKPLDGRPGRWMVRDPSGEVLLEEKAPAGKFGVVAGTFPLDSGAAHGDWHVSWQSGDASAEVSVRVEPFVLPRFRVEATPSQPFYRAHETPSVKGKVIYSSGAPVAGAQIAVTWNESGAWPMPPEWSEPKGLPQTAIADKDGAFTLKLPTIPGDLQGQVTLSARLAATDKAGDRVEGAASVLLSEDAIAVSTVTELENGLVDGFNNRMYLRVTKASGEVLANTPVRVKRAWDPGDKGIDTETDADGVAQLQLDPGPAANIVIPALPFRPRPAAAPVRRSNASELFKSEEADLAELSALDRWEPSLAPCRRFVTDESEAQLTVHADPSGAVRAVAAPEGPLGKCVAAAVATQRLSPGRDRLFKLGFTFNDESLARLTSQVQSDDGVPDGLDEQLRVAAMDARLCIPAGGTGGTLRRLALWQAKADSKEVTLNWMPDPQGNAGTDAVAACVQGRVGTHLTLRNAMGKSELGFVRFEATPPMLETEGKPQPTIMQGYELQVVALEKDLKKESGQTRLRMSPGSVPPLRLRASPILAKAGDTIDLELFRGPEYSGEVPKLAYVQAEGDSTEIKVDTETHKAKYRLPDSATGWFEFRAGSATSLVYVRPQNELQVKLSTDKDRYKPGQVAKLGIVTTVGGAGAQAAVGLFGVDESLGQLATLPGPEDMAHVRPQVSMKGSGFPGLDGQALVLGRIQGANAAAATVLRVAGRPTLAEMDRAVSANGRSPFDPVAELTDRFYSVLGELYNQTRLWEEKAPAAEKMRPAKMAELWTAAVAACRARGEKVDDAYGRPLRLSFLPYDLLSLTEPRLVVVQGTRLPEDVENWVAWVNKEKP